MNQVYLNDPAELFDCDMHDAAVLAFDSQQTSVMLLDCQKLNSIWTLQAAKAKHKHGYFDQQVHALDSWGQLPSNWSAHTVLSEPVQTNVLYCTDSTEQSQQTVNDLTNSSISAEHFLDEIDSAADQAAFSLFTEDHPSARYHELLGFYETMHEVGRPETGHDAKETFSGVSLTDHIDPIAHLVKLTKAETVLDFGSGKGKLYHDAPGYPANSRYKTIPSWGNALVTCYDPGYQPFSEPS